MKKSPFMTKSNWTPVGRYPQKVVSFMPWNTGWIETKDSRVHKIWKNPLRKAKRK